MNKSMNNHHLSQRLLSMINSWIAAPHQHKVDIHPLVRFAFYKIYLD